jgi:hypothetical protein
VIFPGGDIFVKKYFGTIKKTATSKSYRTDTHCTINFKMCGKYFAYRVESGEERVVVLDLDTHPGGQLVHQGKEFVALQLLRTLLHGQFIQYILYKGGNF